MVLVLGAFSSRAQSLIVGIPSADVAEKGFLELTHESQISPQFKPAKWNSFNFFCYGLGNHTELTVTFNNLSNQPNSNLALGAGFKKVFPLSSRVGKQWEMKAVVGANFLYSLPNQNTGVWAYSLFSFRVPSTKTRFTGGLTYGESQTFGFRQKMINQVVVNDPIKKVTFMGGVEQPIFGSFSLIADWYAGTHDLAAFIPAIQKDIGHHVLIMGYKIPNNKISGDGAFILEFMVSIPTHRKGKKH